MVYVQNKNGCLLFTPMRKSKVFSYEDNDVSIYTFFEIEKKNLIKIHVWNNSTYIPMPRIKLAQLLIRR
jgi:hypothetical protein